MAHISNRSAEFGGEIIENTVERTYGGSTGKQMPVAVRVIADAVIATIESPNMINVAYYEGKTITPDDPLIMANITKIELTSGVVQVINGG